MKIDIIKYVGVTLVIIFFCLFVSKNDLLAIIQKALPYRESGLLAGIVLGDKSGFDKTFYSNLVASGLVHIVVASGSNATILIGGLIEMLAPYLNRRWSIVGGLILGWKYVVMVGWEIPIVRAMLFLSCFYFAQLMGKKFNIWRGLLLMLLIMVAGEWEVIKSISFWLSIIAFGAILTKPKIRRPLIWENVVTTFWVSLWLTPMIWLIFGKISWVSPLTNLLVFVLIEVVTVTGIIGSVVGLWCFNLGKTILWLLIPSLQYLELVIKIGGLAGTISGNINWMIIAGWYLVIGYFLVRYKFINNFAPK